jgi:hypothetical protein
MESAVVELPTELVVPAEPAPSFDHDGRIGVVIDGQPFVLRRPLVGEYRRFRESMHTRLAKERDIIVAAEAAQKTDPQPAHVTQAKLDDLTIEWFRDVFGALNFTGMAFPEDNERCPMCFLESGMMTRFVTHWRDRPLARSNPL